MAYIKWSKVEKRENSNKKLDGDGIFMKFKEGKFRVRCLGEPYEFYQVFIPKKFTKTERDVPVTTPDDDDNPLVKLGFNPTKKLAINVLDRKDENKLKIMRIGPAVYNHIANYFEETGTDPCDKKDGPDILISVEDPGGQARQRKYTVTFLQPTKITKEEAKAIVDAGGLHDLAKHFKASTTEEIEELIDKYELGSVDGSANFDDEDGGQKGSSRSSAKDNDDDDDDDVGAEAGAGDDDDDDYSF